MSNRKALLALSATILIAASASAQVFVIGGGLGGDCYNETKNATTSFKRAEKICTRALTEDPMTRANRAATFANRGILRMRHGEYDSSLQDFANAIEMQPELGAAYLNQGAAYIYKRNFPAAITALDQAIALNSDQIHAAYYNRAIAREQSGDVPGAYDDFKTASELMPDWPQVVAQLERFIVGEPVG